MYEMGAVDVAFTEATVGAGIHCSVGRLFSFEEKIQRLMKFFLIPVIAIGVSLWAGQDFPEWGDESPASQSPVSSRFIGNTGVDTEVPNMVTAVLADYRGFDTMFETVVVFIAGIAVIAILVDQLQGGEEGRIWWSDFRYHRDQSG